jgi:hypothetical protein
MRTFLFKLFFNEKYSELFISRIKYGGDLRERILLKLLDKYFLTKIKNSLTDDGIFVGSESLGRVEGKHDHLQFFDELEDLQKEFAPYFKFITGKEATYPLFNCDIIRREGFWRCANNTNVIKSLEWRGIAN